MKKTAILFSILFLALMCTFVSLPSFADAIEKNSAAQLKNDENDTMSSIMDSLLSQQQIELDTMREELAKMGTYLTKNIPILRQETNLTDNEFRDISTIAKSAVAVPAELDILQEQNARLIYKLSEHYTPLAEISTQLEARLKQLEGMKKNVSVDNRNTKSMMTEIRSYQNSYRIYQSNLDKYLIPSKKLLAKIEEANNEYKINMPRIWLNYYLTGTTHVFSQKRWQREFRNLNNLSTLLTARIVSDIPQNASTWLRIFSNSLLAGAILMLLLYTSKKATRRLPLIFHITWKKIANHSAPWFVAGIALHYSAWIAGEPLHIIASIATFCLCLGQMNLAWDIFTMQKSNIKNRSPLWFLFIPLFVSNILFYIGQFPLITALIWFVMLCLVLYYLYVNPKSTFTIPRYLIYGFMAVLFFGILATPSGFSRLSILTCMIYTAFALAIHQITAFMHASEIMQEYLPQNGMSAIFSRALLSIGIPLILLVAIFSPAIWIMAYPGGEYIIHNIQSLDFHIGKMSFNVWQLLSLFIVFYITRSVVKIASSFLDTSWSKNHAATASLTTPIKTTISFATWGAFIIYLLYVIGFNLTSISFIAGGLSVGVGLGLQSIVQNVFSGFSLIFGQNIREGDVVEVGTVLGVVQKVGMRATQMRTYDNSIVFVPNAQFISTAFINWTHNGRMVRRTIPIGVAYGSDLAVVEDTTLMIIKEHDKILKYPEPAFMFLNFGASSLDFELRFWITNVDESLDILSEIRFAIAKAYKENGIEIPFPQTDIHVYKHEDKKPENKLNDKQRADLLGLIEKNDTKLAKTTKSDDKQNANTQELTETNDENKTKTTRTTKVTKPTKPDNKPVKT